MFNYTPKYAPHSAVLPQWHVLNTHLILHPCASSLAIKNCIFYKFTNFFHELESQTDRMRECTANSLDTTLHFQPYPAQDYGHTRPQRRLRTRTQNMSPWVSFEECFFLLLHHCWALSPAL